MNIEKIIASKIPPVDKFVGWLKPVNGKYLELNFFLNGAWRPVSIGEDSGSGTGGNGGESITEIECDTTYPLNLCATTEDGKTVITGYVNLSGYAQVSDIPEKTSELTNDSGFVTQGNLDSLKDELEKEITAAAEGGVTKLEVSGEAPLTLSASITDGALTITGSIAASSASANGYMSSTQYTQLANLVEDPLQYATAITIAEIDALFD